jgi:16S rRNA (guanine527-N7)-methyltransferase
MATKHDATPPHAPTPAEVSAEAARAGFELTPPQADALSRYLTLLLKWSRAMNLIGRADWPGVFRDLAADSLHLAHFLAELDLPAAPHTLDLGAGAGLPGVPLRTVWDNGDYVLVELREKRAVFLTQAVGALRLPRTRVENRRAEELPPGQADLLLSRAFMPWPKLLPLAASLLRPGGRLVILANEAPPADADAFTGAGFRLETSRAYPSESRTRYFWALANASSMPPLKMSFVASASA